MFGMMLRVYGMNNMWERVKEFTWRDKMEKLNRDVLEKYRRKNLPSEDLAKLIIAHMKVGINGKKGWYLNLNSHNNQYERAEELIEEYQV